MKLECAFVIVASAIAVPAAAQIADPDPTGIEVGARAGYGRALGSRVEGERFENTWDGALPLVLDVGYRITPHLYLGGMLAYVPLQLDKNALHCNTQVVDGPGDCSGFAARVAVDAQWRAARDWYAAWFGLGFGLERMAIDYKAGGGFSGPFSRVDTGVEFIHVEAGVGVRAQPGLVIGPFARYDAGVFLASKISSSGLNSGSDIPDKAVHGSVWWGARVMYTVP